MNASKDIGGADDLAEGAHTEPPPLPTAAAVPSAAAALSKSKVRAALARRTFDSDVIRLTGATLDGHDCLIASRQGLFAGGRDGSVDVIAHGYFFGIRTVGDMIFAFEACDRPQSPSRMGRIIRLRREAGRLVEPVVLAKGIDNHCHQIAIFDASIWVVDTWNQAILQFALDGTPLGRRTPFPAAQRDDKSGGYLHLNALANVGDRVALMLHNGSTDPAVVSELAWLDRDWRVLERQPLAGYCCHDIVGDETGVLWHCGSMAGEIINTAGLRVKISDRMTRGLAVTPHSIVVGSSNFGPRDRREQLAGSVIFLDRNLSTRVELELPAAPTDLVML